MRWFVLLVMNGLLVAQDAGPVAARMWSDFRSVVWRSDMQGWLALNTSAMCRRSEMTTMSLPGADEEFCRECATTVAGVSSSSFFYAFDLEPLACVLLQFRTASPPATGGVAERIYEDLRGRLKRAHGAGRDPGKLAGHCSAYWRRTWLWETPDLQVLLFVNECMGQTPKVELLARHRRLIEAKSDDARIRYQRWERFEERERQFFRSLTTPLGAVLPRLPALLEERQPWKADADSVLAHVQILAKHAAIAPAESKPMFLIAADRLAGMLGYLWKPPFDGPHRRRIKAGEFELTYAWSHLGDTWVYDRALLRHVWRVHAETKWGEWAFVALQNRGWFAGAGCPADPALFRRVVSESERFLERRPDSPYKVDVLFDLAQAYETWWSLSQASPQDSYVKPEDYAKGAEEARNRAVELYQQILRDFPQDSRAVLIMRVLPRLKLRIDTGQRRFYCIYD